MEMGGASGVGQQVQTNHTGDNPMVFTFSDRAKRKAKERLNTEDPVTHIPHKSLVSTVEPFETNSFGEDFNIGVLIREQVPKRLSRIDSQMREFEYHMAKLETERQELSRYMDVVAEMDTPKA
jgi:hypothetical protein